MEWWRRQHENKHPRADGRRRAGWEGELEGETDEEEVKAYVLPEVGKLRVFRCPECEVRIAQEADVCRQPSLKRWKLSATFTRTFNLVESGGYVCCLRCGNDLFPFDDKDPAMLTLPLYWHDKRVFKKTPLRATVVLDMADLGGQGTFLNKWKSKEPAFSSVDSPHQKAFLAKTATLETMLQAHLGGRDVQTTVLIRYGFFPEQRQERWEKKTNLEHYRKLYRDAGANFHLMPYPETVDTLTALPTQDLGIYLLWMKDEGNFIQWTDFNAEYTEPGFLTLWTTCGGNMLFGNWFIPMGGKPAGRSTEQDLEAMADNFESDHDVPTNAQPAFTQLVRDGHYLGYWPSASTSLPDHARDKIVAAADYRLLYPRWLFLRDFPPSEFGNPSRRQTDKPFALEATDNVVPRVRDVVVQVDEQQNNCNIL